MKLWGITASVLVRPEILTQAREAAKKPGSPGSAIKNQETLPAFGPIPAKKGN